MTKIAKAMSLIATANQNVDGREYSLEALQEMADKNDFLELEGDKLYLTVNCQNPDPEVAKILDESFWDLIGE
jgi:hypothetical protein